MSRAVVFLVKVSSHWFASMQVGCSEGKLLCDCLQFHLSAVYKLNNYVSFILE